MEAAELKKHVLRVKDGMTAENRFYAAKHLLKAITSFALHYEKVIKYSYSQRVRTSIVKTEYVPEPPEIYQIANAASVLATKSRQSDKMTRGASTRNYLPMAWTTTIRSSPKKHFWTYRTG
jgi:hypothetical protein